MKKVLLISALVVTLGAVGSASAQNKPASPDKPKADETKKTESSVVSRWDVVISAPGQDHSGVLKIDKTGDGYKGTMTTEFGEAPLTGLKVEADSFTAVIAVSAMGQSFEGTILGKVKEGKITGEMNLNGLGTLPYAGKKP